MSEQREDGGAAFAAMGVGPAGHIYHEHGMSLRDWFAGQVLPAIWAEDMATDDAGITGMTLPEIAHEAYRMADEMLAERQKP